MCLEGERQREGEWEESACVYEEQERKQRHVQMRYKEERGRDQGEKEKNRCPGLAVLDHNTWFIGCYSSSFP